MAGSFVVSVPSMAGRSVMSDHGDFGRLSPFSSQVLALFILLAFIFGFGPVLTTCTHGLFRPEANGTSSQSYRLHQVASLFGRRPLSRRLIGTSTPSRTPRCEWSVRVDGVTLQPSISNGGHFEEKLAKP